MQIVDLIIIINPIIMILAYHSLEMILLTVSWGTDFMYAKKKTCWIMM